VLTSGLTILVSFLELFFMVKPLLIAFHPSSCVVKTMKKFYGLRGLHLNVAIAVVAGIDFALFGYDQVWNISLLSGRGRALEG
jgi:hypothetical protein